MPAEAAETAVANCRIWPLRGSRRGTKLALHWGVSGSLAPSRRPRAARGKLIEAMVTRSSLGPRSQVFWARWGFFVVAGVLGALLVVSTLTSYLNSRELLGTIEQGQRVAVEQSLRASLPRRGTRIDQEQLQAAFEVAEPLGLRYVALLNRDGVAEYEVGEPLGSGPARADGQSRFGDRMRVVGPVHVGPPRFGARRRGGEPGPGPMLAPPPGQGPPPGPPPMPPGAGSFDGPPSEPLPPARFLIEVEMSAARALEVRSMRDATIGLAVSVALMLGAFVFGRLATRTERIANELRNQRELATLGEMSAVLAHELRNPLAAMKGNAELLAEGLRDDERRARQAQRVYEGAARLERLTEDLLDFVRAGKVERLIQSPKQLARRAADAAGLERVEIDDAGAPESWALDEDRVMQALVNLLRNAGQASEGKPVELKVTRESGHLVYEIRDHGPGVAPEDRDRIFEAFVTTRTRGTGLGLAVVRRVAELHGGRVLVRTHPEGGAIFRLEIGNA